MLPQNLFGSSAPLVFPSARQSEGTKVCFEHFVPPLMDSGALCGFFLAISRMNRQEAVEFLSLLVRNADVGTDALTLLNMLLAPGSPDGDASERLAFLVQKGLGLA